MRKPFVILDTETTDLDPSRGEIIEIALHRMCQEDQYFMTRVKPAHIETASPKALEINGYSKHPEDWDNAPSMAEVLPRVIKACQNGILVGHNIGFDKSFLEAAHREMYGVGLPFYHVLDTVTLAMEHLPDLASFSLNPVCQVLGISNEDEHTAIADVFRTEAVLMKLLRANRFDRWRWKRRIFKLGLDKPKKRS